MNRSRFKSLLSFLLVGAWLVFSGACNSKARVKAGGGGTGSGGGTLFSGKDGTDDPSVAREIARMPVDSKAPPSPTATPTPVENMNLPVELRMESLDGPYPFLTALKLVSNQGQFKLNLLHSGHDRLTGTNEEIGTYEVAVSAEEAAAIQAMVDGCNIVQFSPPAHGILATLWRRGRVVSQWDGESPEQWPCGNNLIVWFRNKFQAMQSGGATKVGTLRLNVTRVQLTGARHVVVSAELSNTGRDTISILNPTVATESGPAVFVMNQMRASPATVTNGGTKTNPLVLAPGQSHLFEVTAELTEDAQERSLGVVYTTGRIKSPSTVLQGYLLCIPPPGSTSSCLNP